MHIVAFPMSSSPDKVDLFFELKEAIYPTHHNTYHTGIENPDQFISNILSLESDHIKYHAVLGIVDNTPVARILLRRDSKSTVVLFSHFEIIEEFSDLGPQFLKIVESQSKDWGCHELIGPRFDNFNLGMLTSGFNLPQTIFTNNNPEFYPKLFRNTYYNIHTSYKSYLFDRSLPLKLLLKVRRRKIPDNIITREFERNEIVKEIQGYHALSSVFYEREGYIKRSLDEDKALVTSLLPIIDDELIIIAEDLVGSYIGMVICLPDINSIDRDGVIRGARIMTIAVRPDWQGKNVATALLVHLADNLIKKSHLMYAEASIILEGNKSPNVLARLFGAKSGRSFTIFSKKLV